MWQEEAGLQTGMHGTRHGSMDPGASPAGVTTPAAAQWYLTSLELVMGKAEVTLRGFICNSCWDAEKEEPDRAPAQCSILPGRGVGAGNAGAPRVRLGRDSGLGMCAPRLRLERDLGLGMPVHPD